jgi:hypothetical protein
MVKLLPAKKKDHFAIIEDQLAKKVYNAEILYNP